MFRDLRDALRQLRKAPGFTTTVILTLALGIGATTAIFTLVHQVMLKSLPVTKPEELWRIGDKIRCCNWGGYTQGEDNNFSLFSWEAYNYFRGHSPEFSDLAALQAGNAQLGVRRAGAHTPVDTRNGQYVSGNFFRTFGIQPWTGRLLTDSDDKEGAPFVAVMSYRVWQQKYGADPSVVGSTFQINGYAFTIIGVAPPGFYGARLSGWGMPDFWLPIASEQALPGTLARMKKPRAAYLDIIGRVRPGVDPHQLEARLRVELHEWLASHVPEMEPGELQLWQKQTVHLIPGGDGVTSMRADYKDGLKLLFIAASCVLLVACGNLANLMLARGLKDRAQIAIRIAMGASRARLIRKALVETVTLAVIGGACGIAVAIWGARLILYLAVQIGGKDNYVPISATPSWPVLLFALGVSVFTGLLFGVAPAWLTSHADPAEALRGANRSVGSNRSVTQKTLVIGQVAMSIVLLSAAALLGRSLSNLKNQDFGFEHHGRYVAWINPTLSNLKPEQMEPLYRQINERLLAIPGVRSVAPALYAPMTGDSWNEGIRVQGQPEPDPKSDSSAGWARITPSFFDTLGAKIALGRAFTDEDTSTTRHVAVINQAFANRFFKGQNPIGQHFGEDRLKYSGTFEVVGVARDIRYMTWGYKEPIRPMFWVPEAQAVQYDDPNFTDGDRWSHYLYNIVLWAPNNPTALEANVRKALASVNSELVVNGVDSYTSVVNADFQQQSMIATLTTLFGILGLLLAAIGLYGVMSYIVEQRTSEIGLRMAVGANRSDIVRMILRGSMWQIIIGLGIGIPLAILAGKLLKDQLFNVHPWDPVMLASAALLLSLSAFLASALPARRAADVDPMTALRNEG